MRSDDNSLALLSVVEVRRGYVMQDEGSCTGHDITLLVRALGPTGVEFAAELYDFLNEDLVGYVSG